MRFHVVLLLLLALAAPLFAADRVIQPVSVRSWHHPLQPGVVFAEKDGNYSVTVKPEKGVSGYWFFRYNPPVTAGRTFRLSVHCDNPEAMRNNRAVALAVWYDDDGIEVESTYLDPLPGGLFSRTVRRPPTATYLQLEVSLRWLYDKPVSWSKPELIPAADPPRPVRVIVTKAVPNRENASMADNMTRFESIFEKIEEAGEKPDLIVFPENFLTRGVPKLTLDKGAQFVPGPLTDYLGTWAKKLNSYVVTSLWRTDGNHFYNTAVLIDRQGKVAGTFDKVHLTIGEARSMTPGESYPVFDLDFGRIGMLVCWDLWFPESVRELRLKGAELIAYPIAGTRQQIYDYLWPARCQDNQVFLATAITGHTGAPSRILDHYGRILTETREPQSFAAATIDLNERIGIPYLSTSNGTGEMGHIYLREARPETYNRAGTVAPVTR